MSLMLLLTNLFLNKSINLNNLFIFKKLLKAKFLNRMIYLFVVIYISMLTKMRASYVHHISMGFIFKSSGMSCPIDCYCCKCNYCFIFSHIVLNLWTRNVPFNIRSLTMLMCSDLSVNLFLIHVTVVFLPNALCAVLSLLSQGMELNTTAKTIIQVSVFSACSVRLHERSSGHFILLFC